MNAQTSEETCRENLREWGYRHSNKDGKYSDECWKIQFAGPSACEHCNHRDEDGDANIYLCTGLFIRETGFNEMGHRVPLRHQRTLQRALPGMHERMVEEAMSEETAIRLMIDEGMRRADLIAAEIVPAAFKCEECNGEFWFESRFTTSILQNPDDENPEEEEFCSDNCRMYHEEEAQWCEACGQHIHYEHFTFNEHVGDPVCNKCVKDEFINGSLLDDFISDEKIPPDFGVVPPDGFKHIKCFDEYFIGEVTSLQSFCATIERIQRTGHVLVLRPDAEAREDYGSVEVWIKPFSKNKLRKARKYGKAI
jgi:hypothetical protein